MRCPRCKGTGQIEIATLSDRLVMWREMRGISMREASRQMGVSSAFLSMMETGRQKNPSAEVLIKIADFYEVPLDEVLGRVWKPSNFKLATNT